MMYRVETLDGTRVGDYPSAKRAAYEAIWYEERTPGVKTRIVERPGEPPALPPVPARR